ncbi:hypothetical protein D3C72_1275900 [compost metagenome]
MHVEALQGLGARLVGARADDERQRDPARRREQLPHAHGLPEPAAQAGAGRVAFEQRVGARGLAYQDGLQAAVGRSLQQHVAECLGIHRCAVLAPDQPPIRPQHVAAIARARLGRQQLLEPLHRMRVAPEPDGSFQFDERVRGVADLPHEALQGVGVLGDRREPLGQAPARFAFDHGRLPRRVHPPQEVHQPRHLIVVLVAERDGALVIELPAAFDLLARLEGQGVVMHLARVAVAHRHVPRGLLRSRAFAKHHRLHLLQVGVSLAEVASNDLKRISWARDVLVGHGGSKGRLSV